MKQETKNQPDAKFTAGAVAATIWSNASTDGSFNTVSLSRSYKDKAGNWQQTATLRINDLPKAALVLSKAYEHLTIRKETADA